VARVDILMPQMGESIAEGTLSRWLKKVGDEVKRDEPIFEISTDKVDAEIPAPAAGVLAEIIVKEGETVAVQTLVARLETEKGAAIAAPDASAPAAGAPAPGAPAAAKPAAAMKGTDDTTSVATPIAVIAAPSATVRRVPRRVTTPPLPRRVTVARPLPTTNAPTPASTPTPVCARR